MANYYRVLAENRQARFNYEILETHEAGIELLGTEVKAVKGGQANLRDAYGIVRKGQIMLLNMYIPPHRTTSVYFNHEPTRTRRLLLHKDEIRKLIAGVQQKGLTLVPLKVYQKEGWIKVDLAVVRNKKLHDKREDMKKRDDKREIERVMKNH
ncbi:MAG: SsrA-binding protein SmpB [Pseudanabaena sp.]|jgi:SsrA-binding protein|uniref:SsrA-binding protein SmpB n=1 Tax=Pseudanabaena sp. UWO311 TaxID=2487337 RepID=UPI00115AB1A3|nr:SsrA-binding protein SmpB [Pseudanabaena sp. UWO311]MCA6502448.1 SsrA-binding protein SmpB [Pseudanabaena sp. M090S1SP2A07QC]MCA6508103.1 SsrA-binding protein SmpB [Pseudanabaena sp. M172S2SP2A07QC]MCA6508612.1 SsrA-binding protein SmpB [Pseudanabaena sp. M109S1SP2A07QC]MCA6517703.1 SsrA-binding protein SmpB [Pseudanabaena sp. M110S1SP2A07QC]MCA6521790.1 SsrA-binding protein SmpB [Pseudanabaena sp. M051S1SP2A07QC]MCA6527255.1 SsrA-binding protein SmpB [Pseudanabaena sp. M179S2SP2A07QC]MCA